MANLLYNEGRNAFANGTINFTTSSQIKCILVRTTGTHTGPYYTTPAVGDTFSTIPANTDAVPNTAISLGSLAVGTAGQLNAANAAFTTVATTSPTNDPIQGVVVYWDNGSTKKLLVYIDTSTGSPGLPVTPNGGEIDVNWPSGTVAQI